ncbi:hypothetical protein PI23P_04602 [Polaribacter irgensii 23-P]|uniref:Uncharacterized protein n=1 Tax=Polaribacter irgensii 23-P TaxID=313594 RepID=A4BXQ7_9FLAO|nr:hypothetical protein [Polaribacter irgensii]EAR13748.1 hypothetical protein PI23P_04602 [Polaribacter irgensii 23-P]
MKQFLKKIEWKTRHWNFEFALFNIYFPTEFRVWGFELFKIRCHLKDFSLLKLQWRLPNGAERTQVQFFWDLFFTQNYLEKRAIEKAEAKLWSNKK